MKRIYVFLVCMAQWVGAAIDEALTGYQVAIGGILQFGSIIPKMPHSRRNVANGTGGYTTQNGQVKLELNKDFLTSDHRISVLVAQVFATTAPNAFDVRRFFSKIELQSNEGTIFSSAFDQFYDAMRYLELASAPVNYAGVAAGAAATSSFSFNMHHANDQATLDLLTALQTADFSTLSLVLTCAPDANNGFIGGVAPAAANFTVGVDTHEYQDSAFSGDSAAQRKTINYGKARHHFKSMDEKSSASAAASNQEVQLDTGGRTRFLFLHSYNTTSGVNVLANGVVNQITLNVNGKNVLQGVQFANIQQENVAKRGFNQAGIAVLDMGDDPKGWIRMEDVNTVKLQYSTLGTAPAGWLVRVAQDYTTGLAALGV